VNSVLSTCVQLPLGALPSPALVCCAKRVPDIVTCQGLRKRLRSVRGEQQRGVSGKTKLSLRRLSCRLEVGRLRRLLGHRYGAVLWRTQCCPWLSRQRRGIALA
jgi:hypothetical protein